MNTYCQIEHAAAIATSAHLVLIVQWPNAPTAEPRFVQSAGPRAAGNRFAATASTTTLNIRVRRSPFKANPSLLRTLSAFHPRYLGNATARHHDSGHSGHGKFWPYAAEHLSLCYLFQRYSIGSAHHRCGTTGEMGQGQAGKESGLKETKSCIQSAPLSLIHWQLKIGTANQRHPSHPQRLFSAQFNKGNRNIKWNKEQ
jgi:hypothetical protein